MSVQADLERLAKLLEDNADPCNMRFEMLSRVEKFAIRRAVEARLRLRPGRRMGMVNDMPTGQTFYDEHAEFVKIKHELATQRAIKEQQEDYAIKLQRVIEAFCRGDELPYSELHHTRLLADSKVSSTLKDARIDALEGEVSRLRQTWTPPEDDEDQECREPCPSHDPCDECAEYWQRMRDEGYWDDMHGWMDKGMREMRK